RSRHRVPRGDRRARRPGTGVAAAHGGCSRMRRLLLSAVYLVLTASVVAASPAVSPRVTIVGAAQLGVTDHPDGGGVQGGLHFRVAVQLWWLTLGGTVGIDLYAD